MLLKEDHHDEWPGLAGRAVCLGERSACADEEDAADEDVDEERAQPREVAG